MESLASYSAYLTMKNKAMKIHHASPEPPTNFDDSSCLRYLTPISSSNMSPLLADIDEALNCADNYEIVKVAEYCPKENRRRY